MVPDSLKEPVLYAGHEAAGHFGAHKTKLLVSDYFYWPGMGREVTQYCRECPTCLQWNHQKEPKAPLRPLPVVATPWTKIAIDVVGPLPTTKDGYKYLLTIIDFGTRFVETIPLREWTPKQPVMLYYKFFPALGCQKQYSVIMVPTLWPQLLKNYSSICNVLTSLLHHTTPNPMAWWRE